MAKILDLRGAGGQLVIIGDAIAVPTSNSTTFSDTSPRVAGSLRYNPDVNRVEFLSKNSLDWLSIGGIGEDDLSGYVSKSGDTMSGTLTLTGTARVRVPDGSTSSPAIGFVSASTTGHTLIGGALATVVGGTTRLLVGANSTTISNQIIATDGSVSSPTLAFATSANSGLYYTANSVNISVNGTARVLVGANSTTIANQIIATNGVAASPALAFATSSNSGLYYTTNAVNISVNGNAVSSFTTTSISFLQPTYIPQGSISAPGLGFNGATNTGISLASGNIVFGLAGTERARITSTGVTASLFSGTATSAQYADLAERYHADKNYPSGTVLVIGGENEVTISTIPNDSNVVGIVSTAPGYMLNSEAGDDSTHPYVALKGRVPCKVIGPIKKGDLLTTSNVPGHAMTSNDKVIGSIIGKALSDFDDLSGIIEVLV